MVPGSEEPLRAAEESFVVFVIVDALPGAERLGHLRLPEVARGQHFEPAAKEHRAVLVGQDHGVFVGQLVAGGGRVVRDVACCGLVVQPLADIPLGGSGGVGEFGRGERPGTGHRLVQAEFVTDVHQGAGDRHAHVGHGLVHERVELLFGSIVSRFPPGFEWMSSTRGAPGPPVGCARSVLAVSSGPPGRRLGCGVPEVGPGSLTSGDRWSDMIRACHCGYCT